MILAQGTANPEAVPWTPHLAIEERSFDKSQFKAIFQIPARRRAGNACADRRLRRGNRAGLFTDIPPD